MGREGPRGGTDVAGGTAMPRMTDDEIVAFLDEPGHLVRIGTTDADGYPSVVPTWFIHRDGLILFTPRGPAAFLANIRRDPRIGLSIDEDPLPYRKVTVRGTARIVHEPGDDDVWRDLYRSHRQALHPGRRRRRLRQRHHRPAPGAGRRPPGRRRHQGHHVADAGGRRGRHRHLAPSLLPRRHPHGRAGRLRAPGAPPTSRTRDHHRRRGALHDHNREQSRSVSANC